MFEWLDGNAVDPLKLYKILRRNNLVPIDGRMELMIQQRIKRGLVKTEKFKPTFLEKISGKSASEILKQRKEALEFEQNKREKEAKLRELRK